MSENELIPVGLKVGSQNTALAYRNNGNIVTSTIKTCVRYPKTLQNKPGKPVIGELASKYADAIWPMNLGGIETESGIEHTRNILKYLTIPEGAFLVLAAPAAEVNDGKQMLVNVVKDVFKPHNDKVLLFSEALCSVVCIMGIPDIVVDSTILAANLGSSTLEVGCFSQADIVHLSAHKEVSGNTVDSAIVNSVTNKIGDQISIHEARMYKEMTSLIDPQTFPVKTSNRKGLVEAQVNEEIIKPIEQYAEKVAEVLRIEMLNNISPIVRKQALDNPLFICGGMANIEGLPELITEILNEKLGASIEARYPTGGNCHVVPAIGAMMLAEALREE